jgi:hypothetical protein
MPADEAEYGFAISVPFYGKVKKLVVKQTGGTAVPFTVNLYSARVVKTANNPTPAIDLNVTPKDLYKIIPTQAQVSAGGTYFLVTDNDGYAYMNIDVSPITSAPSMANPTRNIYVTISLGSAVPYETTWSVGIALCTEGN